MKKVPTKSDSPKPESFALDNEVIASFAYNLPTMFFLSKLSSRSWFILGFLILALSGLSLILNHPGFASRLVAYAYWPFLIGTLIYLWETLKSDKD